MLNDAAIRHAKAPEKAVKLFDSGGLYLNRASDRRTLVALEIPP